MDLIQLIDMRWPFIRTMFNDDAPLMAVVLPTKTEFTHFIRKGSEFKDRAKSCEEIAPFSFPVTLLPGEKGEHSTDVVVQCLGHTIVCDYDAIVPIVVKG